MAVLALAAFEVAGVVLYEANSGSLVIGAFGLFWGLAVYVLVRKEAVRRRILNREIANHLAQLRRSEEKYRAVVENMTDVFYRTDRNGKIVMVSPSAVDLIGYPVDELLGRELHGLYFDPGERDEVLRRILDSHGSTYYVEVRLRRKDGQVIWVSGHSRALFDDNGDFAGVEGVSRDITESKRLLAESQALKEAAERADAAKTRFLAAASHDLRQPVQAAQLFVSLLRDQVKDPGPRTVVERIEQALEAMGGLLESLLDISKLEAGATVPSPEDFAVGDLLAKLTGEFAAQFAEKGIALRSVACSARVRSDPVLLANILRNLLGNALRYTQQGKVLIGCRRRGDGLVIGVADTGCGIAADQLDLVFQEFYQVGNPERDRRKGLGLGLSIVEKTAKLLGHEVAVSSRPGRGSVFTVTVPLAAAASPVAVLAEQAAE